MSGTFWITLIALIAFGLGVLACRALARRHLRLMHRLAAPHCIDRAGPVVLSGVQQWVSIRGRDRRNPVLLFLHGGPGTAFSGVAYSYQGPWEEYFTVVNWDQRGSGRSRSRGGEAVTLETLITDALELIDYLRQELAQDRIFVIGHSWGGFLGLTIAHRRPEVLHAFVGLGPLLGVREGYREGHRVLSEAAAVAGDGRALGQLRSAGTELPAPDDRGYLGTLRAVVGLLPAYGMSWHNQTSTAALFARVLTIAFFSPDLKLRHIGHPLGGGRSYVRGLFRDIHDLYLPETLGARFETPIILISGEHDQQGPIELVRAYSEQIEAPSKMFRVLRGSAHAAVWEAPGQILAVLLQDVLPCAKSAGRQAANC